MVQAMVQAGSLTEPSLPPALAAEVFYLEHWNTIRDSGVLPLHQSDLNEDPALREEFLGGARLLGVIGRRKVPQPQQLRLVDALNAGYRRMAVLLPRRSAKSTTILALALGRCLARDDYAVAYTQMTTGADARKRFRADVIDVLDRLFPNEAENSWKLYRGSGTERIQFSNGSSIRILVPQADAFRGDAYDMVILDESGAATPEMSRDIVQGLLPTMDTRPGAQLIVAGTAAEYRDGNILWESLERARLGKVGAGIVEYASPDTTDLSELDTWEGAKALVLAAHPGISTEEAPDNLTTLDIAQERWEELSRAQFTREYLSIFGTAGAVQAFLNVAAWNEHGESGAMPDMPTDRAVGLAVTVHPDQSVGAITAAWRDDEGKACILLVDYRAGVDWIPKRAKEMAGKLRTSVIYDEKGTVRVQTEVMERMRPRPRMAPQTFADVCTSAALLAKEIDQGNIVHWNQPELTAAIRLVVKRGSPLSNRWAYGRNPKSPGDSIIAAEGASMALRWADENPKRARARAFAA